MATVSRSSKLCSDSLYRQVGYCPAVLTDTAMSSAYGVAATVGVTLDRSDGILYVAVTTNNTPLTAQQVIDATGLPSASKAITSSGSTEVYVTGLTANTNYYFQVVHVNDSGWDGLVSLSAQFTTENNSYAWNYVGIPYPTETTTELTGLGYTAWTYDPSIIAQPSLPVDWVSDESGFYFVQEGGSNVGLGSPVDPKGVLPSTLAAGDVLVISGDVSDVTIVTASGTSGSPCWVISDTVQGRFVGTKNEWHGSHLILDGVNSYEGGGNGAGGVHVVDGSFMTVRNGDFSADKLNSRQGISVVDGSDHIMLFNNKIYDFGDWTAVADDNKHGVKMMGSQFWIINNTFHDITNDGVQVGDLNSPNVNLGFIAGNEAYNCAQTGLWLKNCYDIVISSNDVHDHINHPAGAGGYTMMGAQYDFANAWWINNKMHGVGGGFTIASSNGTQTQGARYLIGNIIYDTTNPTYDETNSHDYSAVLDRNGTHPLQTINNTIENTHAGISSPYSGRVIQGNTISEVTAPNAAQLFLFDNSGHTLDYNSYEGTATVKFGGSSPSTFSALTAASLETNGEENATLTYVDSANGDYTPEAGSSAIDSNILHSAYADFQTRYGFTILEDMVGTTRPVGTWDKGAIEVTA